MTEPQLQSTTYPGEPRWLPLLVLLGLIAGGSLLASSLGLEWSAASIRETVSGLGAWAPLTFVGLLTFRFLILVPSVVMLTAGGLCFGVLGGTLYGALGLTLAGLLKYAVVQWAGADAIRAQVPSMYHGAIALARSKTGVAATALISTFPVGPIGVVHLAAAVTGMALGSYTVAVASGSLVRAGAFAFFGSSLLEGGNLWLGAAGVAALLAAPLAFPRTRAWLRQALRPPSGSDASQAPRTP